MASAHRVPLIELHDASVVLGETRVLCSLTLTIRQGEHTAILGPNGAGKSTLMKLLALEQYPLPSANGTPPVRLFGRDRWEVFALRTQMGIVSADVHDRFVHGNSNGSITALDAALSGFFATQGVFGHQAVTAAMRARAADALDRMGVGHLAAVALDRVSTGEARRVLIARALVHQPHLLILDEPTRGLDLAARHAFMERVRGIAADGTTLLLVTRRRNRSGDRACHSPRARTDCRRRCKARGADRRPSRRTVRGAARDRLPRRLLPRARGALT